MYDSMRTTVPWSALYFVMVLLLGTYLVFNLFIAILLDNFAGKSLRGRLQRVSCRYLAPTRTLSHGGNSHTATARAAELALPP